MQPYVISPLTEIQLATRLKKKLLNKSLVSCLKMCAYMGLKDDEDM